MTYSIPSSFAHDDASPYPIYPTTNCLCLPQRRTHLRLAKKLEFFAAWAMAQPQEDLTAVAAEVLEIVQSQAEVAEEGQRARELASGKPSLQSMLKVAGPSPGAAPQGSALENLKSITQRAMDRRKARRKKQRK